MKSQDQVERIEDSLEIDYSLDLCEFSKLLLPYLFIWLCKLQMEISSLSAGFAAEPLQASLNPFAAAECLMLLNYYSSSIIQILLPPAPSNGINTTQLLPKCDFASI